MPVTELVKKAPPSLSFGVIDGTLLPAHPLALFSQGKFLKVDLLLGFTSHEGWNFVTELIRRFPDKTAEKSMESITADRALELAKIIICNR